jgi:poly-gamma-glutamate synthesis protein (capsule biosynthesis protein)
VFPPQLTSDTFWFNTIYREGKGINVLSTANNHSLDMGVDGLFETCEFLNKTGVTWVGTGRTKEERDDLPVVERSGIKYGFLSWTFGLNNYENPEDKPYLSNHLRINLENPDLSPITRDVEILRKKGADVIVGLIHWSLEFECWPMAHLIETGHRLLSECGIDIVSGNHAHNVQPVEVYRYEKDGVKKQGIIFYAHGDLVSAISMCKNEVLNYISRVQVEKGTLNGIEQTIISGFDLLPTYRYGVNDQNNKNCVLYQQLFKLDKLVSMVENGEELPFEISEEKRLHILHLKKLVQRVIPYAYSDYNQLSFNAEVVTGI